MRATYAETDNENARFDSILTVTFVSVCAKIYTDASESLAKRNEK